MALGLVALVWLIAVAGLAVGYARRLRAAWREPVWRRPLLVLESDDWGPGVLEDAEALRSLMVLLAGHRDSAGRPATMTLGVVLGCADPGGSRTPEGFHRVTLEDARFARVLTAMRDGVGKGVFSPQLHGLEHFRPQSVLAAAARDPAIAEWLARPCAPASELPSHLQSRWTDASVLPSRPLGADEISSAVAEECAVYRRLFGTPAVVVPPTFVWTADVEKAWAEGGVEVIVTPGRRCTRREEDGSPGGVDLEMRNGERSVHGPLYVVRNVYFEPSLGHRADRLVRGLQASWRLGRPCLVEMHRFNFAGTPATIRASLEELDRALGDARRAVADVCFLPTVEIGRILARRDPEWIESAVRPRLRAWLARLDELPRFRKLSRLTGVALPIWLLGLWAAAGGSAERGASASGAA
jgi:hypothetical protein